MPALAPMPPESSPEGARSRRKRLVRAKSISTRRLAKRDLDLGRIENPPIDPDEGVPARPRVRGDCAAVPRPCPFLSCKHHLYLDVSRRTGAIKLNFPDIEPHELPADRSCALDVADELGATLDSVGEAINVTKERVRQIETIALGKVAASSEVERLREYTRYGEGAGKRRLPVLQSAGDDDEETRSS